jgi:hypothetical protein
MQKPGQKVAMISSTAIDLPEHRKHPKTYDDLVWVQCKGYRCLAFTDANHKWMNFYTGKKITDFVKVIG